MKSQTILRLLLGASVLLILLSINTCRKQNAIMSRLDAQDKEIEETKAKIVPLEVLEEELILWETLRMEELSDKNKVPINQLKTESKPK